MAAAALLRSRSRGAVAAAAALDLAGASALVAWLLTDDPAGVRGTLVLAVAAASLVAQAALDVAALSGR